MNWLIKYLCLKEKYNVLYEKYINLLSLIDNDFWEVGEE